MELARIKAKNLGYSDIKISAIICTMPENFDSMLDVLLWMDKQTDKPEEVVIVVDDGEKEKMFDLLYGCKFSFPVVVTESGGTGLSRARNRGAEVATGSVLLYLDDDIVIKDVNLVEAVRMAFEKDRRLGVYGIQVKPLFDNSIELPDDFNWIYGCTDDKAVRPVGAFFAIRKGLAEHLKFPEEVGRIGKKLASGEETYVISRVLDLGLRVILDGKYQVFHLVKDRGWWYVVKRVFYEGISKARLHKRGFKLETERKYAIRYLKYRHGWWILTITVLGFVVGRMEFK